MMKKLENENKGNQENRSQITILIKTESTSEKTLEVQNYSQENKCQPNRTVTTKGNTVMYHLPAFPTASIPRIMFGT